MTDAKLTPTERRNAMIEILDAVQAKCCHDLDLHGDAAMRAVAWMAAYRLDVEDLVRLRGIIDARIRELAS